MGFAGLLGYDSCLLGRNTRRLRGLTQVLLIVPDLFSSDSRRRLRSSRVTSELFGFMPRRLGGDTMLLGDAALLLSALTCRLRRRPHAPVQGTRALPGCCRSAWSHTHSATFQRRDYPLGTGAASRGTIRMDAVRSRSAVVSRDQEGQLLQDDRRSAHDNRGDLRRLTTAVVLRRDHQYRWRATMTTRLPSASAIHKGSSRPISSNHPMSLI